MGIDFAKGATVARGPSYAAEVHIDYVNWRGERGVRRIVPQRLYVADLEWHPGEQWVLDAWDVEKQAIRSFAMCGIRAWTPTSEACDDAASA
jgi:predicted DNA-binding transcriptional regulator YafY